MLHLFVALDYLGKYFLHGCLFLRALFLEEALQIAVVAILRDEVGVVLCVVYLGYGFKIPYRGA